MIGGVLAKTCDAGPAGDKPYQCRIIGTGRITIDHRLAFDHLQQTGVPDLSPRCVPDEEAAKSNIDHTNILIPRFAGERGNTPQEDEDIAKAGAASVAAAIAAQ
jgi:hypothetical protein